MKSNLQKGLLTLIRATVSIGLAAGLIYATLKSSDAGPADVKQHFIQASHWWLILAVLIYGVVVTITVVRWRMLLKVQGVDAPFPTLLRLTLIGMFFNLAIPGAVSGDLIKMAYMARVAPERKAEAVLTILLDRVFGIIGLFLVAAAMIILSLQLLLGLGEEHRAIQAAVFLVGLGSFGGIALLLLLELREKLIRVHWISMLIEFVAKKLPAALVDISKRFITALDLYRRHRIVIIKAIALSIAVHSLLGLDLYMIGRALGENSLRSRDYFLAMQVGNAVGSIPVTPGGVGTRDAVIALFLKALEAHPQLLATFVPLTYSVILVIWALIGSVVFIFSPRRALKAAPQESTS